MINGTNSNLKMTYNSGHSNKSSSRHSNYSNNHSHGPNNLQSGSNHQITANAMAALMNQSMAAAAMMHPFAMSGLPTQPGNHRNHQQGTNQQQTISPLNYFGFTFPNASDPIRSYYHAQPLSGHAPYPNSRMPSSTTSSSPPVTSSGNNVQQSNSSASTNGSTSVSAGSNVANNSVISAISISGTNALTGTMTNGNGNSTPEKSSSDTTSTSSISKTNLYIRGLTPETTDKDLHSLCSPYGAIVSTKAILDKETNKCRGYGFVDFEHPVSAETAVKNLISQGVQAQMAKCTDTNRNKNAFFKSGSEHDPTNLYIANLPLNMTETDLDSMLSLYGSVISTRILKDSNGTPRGVGFARMESKEKCDSIISLLNGKMLPGCKDTLLVKFADGGNKKKHYKTNEIRYRSDVDLQMGFDSTNMATNGVPTQLLPSPLGASAYQRAFSATASPYQSALQATPWLHQGPPQYIMQPQMIPSNMDPNAGIQYSSLMHHLSAQMSHLQLGGVSGTGYMPGNPHAYGTQTIYPPQMLQSMPISGEQPEQINPSHSVSSGSASGEEQQHTFQQMVYNQPK